MRVPFSSFLVALIVFCCSCKSSSKEEVDTLIKDLSNKDPAVRSSAALELADGGAQAKRAVPQLIKLLNDKNVGVRSSAAFSLRKIGTPEASKALENAKAREDTKK